MLGIDGNTGRPLGGTDHLRQSLRDLFTTRLGTRVMREDYGSDLPGLVDAPMNPALAIDLYAATAKAVRLWEPRLRLTRVAITEAEPGRVVLSLEGRDLEGQPITLDGITVT